MKSLTDEELKQVHEQANQIVERFDKMLLSGEWMKTLQFCASLLDFWLHPPRKKLENEFVSYFCSQLNFLESEGLITIHDSPEKKD